MDAMVIVGGRNSANTKRLAALSEGRGTPTYHIETAEDLLEDALASVERIGVSAGASTPNWIIDRVVDTLTAYQAKKKGRFRILFNLWTWAVLTDTYSALGAAALCLTAILLQELPVRPVSLLLAALYVYGVHTVNRVLNRRTSTVVGSFREGSYRRHETAYLVTAVVSLILSLGIGFLAGKATFLIILFMSVLGVLYNAAVLPRTWRFRSIRDLPGSKNISMAIAWATVAAVLPQMAVHPAVTPGMGISFLFIFGLVFIRSALSDIQDIQSDKLVGRETIPVLIGRDVTQRLLKAVSVFLLLALFLAYAANWSSPLSPFLSVTIFYLWICFKVYDRKPGFSGVVGEGILETSYIVTGICSGLWGLWASTHGI